MSSRLSVLLVVSGYLLAASLGLLAWLGERAGAPPPGWALARGRAPGARYLFVAWRTRDLTQCLARSAVCLGLLPVLLLIWGAAVADAFTPAPSSVDAGPQAASDIDLFRLFTGARSVRDVPMGHGGIQIMRRAAFPDSSELSFYRFASAPQAEAHLEFMLRSQRGSPARLSGRDGVRLRLAAERYVYVERHGRELVQVDAQDEAEALARLEAQHVPAPATFVGGEAQIASTTAPVWPFTLSYALAHALALMGFWAWVRPRRSGAAAMGP